MRNTQLAKKQGLNEASMRTQRRLRNTRTINNRKRAQAALRQINDEYTAFKTASSADPNIRVLLSQRVARARVDWNARKDQIESDW